MQGKNEFFIKRENIVSFSGKNGYNINHKKLWNSFLWFNEEKYRVFFRV